MLSELGQCRSSLPGGPELMLLPVSAQDPLRCPKHALWHWDNTSAQHSAWIALIGTLGYGYSKFILSLFLSWIHPSVFQCSLNSGFTLYSCIRSENVMFTIQLSTFMFLSTWFVEHVYARPRRAVKVHIFQLCRYIKHIMFSKLYTTEMPLREKMVQL